MKTWHLLIAFCFFVIVFGCNSKEEKFPKHPRIILLNGAEKELLKKISENSELTQLNNLLLKASDEIIALKPVERIQTGRRILSISRICLKRVLWLSYSFRISGKKKYLYRA